VRAGRLGFGHSGESARFAEDLSIPWSFADSLIRRGTEEWKQKSLFVNHPRRLWDLPQKSIFKL